MSNWKVTLTGTDGEAMVVHPESEATHGVYLAEDQVKGDIIDAPVKTEWESLALQEGGTGKGVDYEYRDVNLGFHVTDNALSAEEADSMLRMKFDYIEDEWDPNPNRLVEMELETEMSGARYLDLLLAETPEHEMKRDPFIDQYFNPKYLLRAGMPYWYEKFAGKKYRTTAFEFGAGDTDGFIEVENRADRPGRPTWVISGGVGTQAILPDVSWVGAKGNRLPAGPHPGRMVTCPEITPSGGGLRVTLERGKLMVKDANGTNALGRMPTPGEYFVYKYPSYLRKTLLPISVRDVPTGGGRIELRMPYYWTRPYGMELF